MSDDAQKNSMKTQAYSTGGDSNKTQAYETNSKPTEVYSDGRVSNTNVTKSYDTTEPVTTANGKTREHHLGVGDRITLNQKEYEVIEIISGEGKTGEAVIYKIKDDQERILALKLYRELPANQEPNPEALSRIKEIDDPDILKLYDYGTSRNKYRQKFCFEIAAYAQGGDLLTVKDLRAKYTPQFLMDHVIPEIFKGIQCLHRHRIYHCDLKPQNVFYLDEAQTDLVIGDYGSAKTFEYISEKNIDLTEFVKISHFYRAPELLEGIITEKNDYYSFGIIILSLLYPEIINDKKEQKLITLRRQSKKDIIQFNPEYKNLNQLIRGLTLQDIEYRWGEKEINSWLLGEYVPVVDGRPSFKPGKDPIYTEKELVQYIETTPNWHEALIEDQHINKQFLIWLSQVQDGERKRLFEKMVQNVKQDGREFVREAILRFFEPERQVVIEFKTYDIWNASDTEKIVSSFFSQLDEMPQMTELKKIRLFLFQLEFSLRQLEQHAPEKRAIIQALLKKIADICGVTLTDEFMYLSEMNKCKLNREKLIRIFYAFNPNRGFKGDKNFYHQPEDVALFYAQNPDKYNDEFSTIERNIFLEKQKRNDLLKLDLNEFMFRVFQSKIKYEIDFKHLDFRQIEQRQVGLTFRIHKSLGDYFRGRGITPRNEISEQTPAEVKFDIMTRRSLKAQQIYQDFLTQLNTNQGIDTNQITFESREKFKLALELDVREYRHSKYVEKRQKVLNYLNFPFFGKSLLFLFPLLAMFLIVWALGMENWQARRFLEPFFALDPPIRGEAPMNLVALENWGLFYFDRTFSIHLFLFLSFLPVIIYRFINTRMRINPEVFKAVIILGSLAIASFIASAYLKEAFWSVLPFILAGITGGIIVFGLIVWIYQLLGWLGLLLVFVPVPTFLLHRFSAPVDFKVIIDGYTLLVLLLVILFWLRIRYFYRAERRFYWPPFLMSVLIVMFTSSLLVGGFHFKWPTWQREELIAPADHYGVINTPAVNIRSAPTPRAEIIGKAFQGERATILGEQSGWYHIQIDTREGYIYQEFINVVK